MSGHAKKYVISSALPTWCWSDATPPCAHTWHNQEQWKKYETIFEKGQTVSCKKRPFVSYGSTLVVIVVALKVTHLFPMHFIPHKPCLGYF
jgi:hypothetical protein